MSMLSTFFRRKKSRLHAMRCRLEGIAALTVQRQRYFR